MSESTQRPSAKPEVSPELRQWPDAIARNRSARDGWDFKVSGIPVADFCMQARKQTLDAAAAFTVHLGVEARAFDETLPLVMTGHQAEFYHPGVWIKDFLVQAASTKWGYDAIDVVVDTDAFDAVAGNVPCFRPQISHCKPILAPGSVAPCFALAPVPRPEHIQHFTAELLEATATLDKPQVPQNVRAFCDILPSIAEKTANLAEFTTLARRRFEGESTDYSELPVTRISRLPAFSAFLVDISLNADRFVEAYNSALAEFRTRHGVRSSAQPFPDLRVEEGRVELPFWHISQEGRRPVWVRREDTGLSLMSADDVLFALSEDPQEAIAQCQSSSELIAPKALALTTFNRMFCCDLFVHGTGGARYDQVTDATCRAYYGVDTPQFVTATLTVHLDLGVPYADEDELGAAQERINRLTHNPDASLAEVELPDPVARQAVEDLIAEKKQLVAEIATPDADKKTLGIRIKQINGELAQAVEPLRLRLEEERRELESAVQASKVARDRTFSYFLWSADEINRLAVNDIDGVELTH